MPNGGDESMFTINGRDWDIVFVPPKSEHLRRSDGSFTVGVTDGNYDTVFISDEVNGSFLRKIVCHELCHCFCMSFNIYMSIDEEERLADWIATYGTDLISLLDSLMVILLENQLYAA